MPKNRKVIPTANNFKFEINGKTDIIWVIKNDLPCQV